MCVVVYGGVVRAFGLLAYVRVECRLSVRACVRAGWRACNLLTYRYFKGRICPIHEDGGGLI